MADWMSTKQVAERFGVPEETVRYWRHVGYGPVAVKLGRHVRYRVEDWERFLGQLVAEEQRKRGVPA